MNLQKNIARAMTAAMVLGTLASFSPAAMASDPGEDVVDARLTMSSMTAGGSAVYVITIDGLNGHTASNLTYTFDTSIGSPTPSTGTYVGGVFSPTGLPATLSGATNPAVGNHLVQIKDGATEVGSIAFATVTNDTITVTATVDPSITFAIGASDTACGPTMPGDADYTVDLGHMDGTHAASSDAETQTGAGYVEHICTLLSTNATGGATVTVKNANGADGLVSRSVDGDKIPSVSGAINHATPNYGLCMGSVTTTYGDAWKAADDTTVVGAEYTPRSATPYPDAVGEYSPLTCTAATNEPVVGLDDVTPTAVWTVADYTSNAFATIMVKAGVSPTQPAHNDYSDTLTFVATATF